MQFTHTLKTKCIRAIRTNVNEMKCHEIWFESYDLWCEWQSQAVKMNYENFDEMCEVRIKFTIVHTRNEYEHEYAVQFAISIRIQKGKWMFHAESAKQRFISKWATSLLIILQRIINRCLVFDASASENNLIYFRCCCCWRWRWLSEAGTFSKWKVTKIKCIWMSTAWLYKPLMNPTIQWILFESWNRVQCTNSMSFHAAVPFWCMRSPYAKNTLIRYTGVPSRALMWIWWR